MAHGQLTQFQTVALTQFQVDICTIKANPRIGQQYKFNSIDNF